MGRGGGIGGGGSGSHGGGSSRTHYGGGAGGGRGGRGTGGTSRPSGGGGFKPGPGPGGPFGGGPHGPGPGMPFGGGPHRPFHVPRPPHHHHHYYGSGSGCGLIGCAPLLVILIIIALVIAIAVPFQWADRAANDQITASTVERTKLPASACQTIDEWFEDNMRPEWVYNDRDLIKGLQTFYDKTGVQPYLVLMPDIDGDVYPTQTEIENELRRIYDEIMPDGGHVVVGFLEGVPNEYGIGVYAGAQAETVMDAEARDILMDYLEYYYTSDLDTEAYFATAFEKTADKIMKMDEIQSVSRAKTIRTVLIVTGVSLAILVIAISIVRSKKHKAEQAKADAEILNSDLSGTDPLKDKYDI